MKNSKALKITSTLAKTEDGTIQITFTVPVEIIKKEREGATLELGKNIEVAGFRPGKAPLEKIMPKIDPHALIEKTLQKVLPKALAEAINEYKIRPAIYPKFELVKAKDDEDWEIRAVTCELPRVEVGDYKKIISEMSKAKGVEKKEPTREEKEQKIIRALVETIKVSIPKVLIDEEVNARLSQLLERIEKLGLNLDSYLASVGKNPEVLRKEYEVQAQNTIALDLILETIVESEGIKVEEEKIDEVIKVSTADPKLFDKINTPEQRRIVASILRRRQALDSLVALL